jgi:hypothetical protein
MKHHLKMSLVSNYYLLLLYFLWLWAHHGLWPPRSWGFLITQWRATALLWTSDQLVAETSNWQHTTHTTYKHPCPRWYSNPRSQQASDRRPTRAHSDRPFVSNKTDKLIFIKFPSQSGIIYVLSILWNKIIKSQ